MIRLSAILVEVVEESTNVPVMAETAAGALNEIAIRCHISPPVSTSCAAGTNRTSRLGAL